MPTGSLQSLHDAVDILDRAIASEKGIRIGFRSYKDAASYRWRLYAARTKDRNLNDGKSVYDSIVIKNPIETADGTFYLELRTAEPFGVMQVEEL